MNAPCAGFALRGANLTDSSNKPGEPITSPE